MPPGFEHSQLLSPVYASPDHPAQAAAERLSQEGNQSFLGGLESGFIDRATQARHNLLGTGLEVGSGIAIGAGLALLSRNPAWLGGFAGTVAEYAPKAFGLMAVSDLSWRALSAGNSNQLGRNFGSALFDYPVMGLSGALGGGTTMMLTGRNVPMVGSAEIPAVDGSVPRTGMEDTRLNASGLAGTDGVNAPRNNWSGGQAVEEPILYNRRSYIDGGDEGSVYNNGNGTITKVYKDPDTDLEKIAGMFRQLNAVGVRVPEIYSYGKTADGEPAMVMQMIGDGDHLQTQLMLGQISAAEKPNVIAQYNAMARTLQDNGLRVDWQLKNMIYDGGKLYLVDPSFIKPQPLDQWSIDFMLPH